MKVCLNESCEKAVHTAGRCKRHYDRERYLKLRESKLAYNKEYRELNKDKLQVTQKRWRENNKERILINGRNRYAVKKEYIDSYQTEWRKKNRLKWNSYRSARRLKEKENGIYLILDKEFKKLNNQLCFYCGSDHKLTMDHIIPIVRGGRHSIGNLVVACKTCNSQKGSKTIQEWRKLQLKLQSTLSL